MRGGDGEKWRSHLFGVLHGNEEVGMSLIQPRLNSKCIRDLIGSPSTDLGSIIAEAWLGLFEPGQGSGAQPSKTPLKIEETCPYLLVRQLKKVWDGHNAHSCEIYTSETN